MERVIVLPQVKENQILSSVVEATIQDQGIITVHNVKTDKYEGHVVFDGRQWMLRTLSHYENFDELEFILVDHPEYTFKFIV